MGTSDSRLVYSTDPRAGRCLTCAKLPADCRCVATRPSKKPSEQTIRMRIEKQKRGGKTVTVCDGFELDARDLAAAGKSLKALCACGGTSAGGIVELQGDHREKAATWLRAAGYKVKQ